MGWLKQRELRYITLAYFMNHIFGVLHHQIILSDFILSREVGSLMSTYIFLRQWLWPLTPPLNTYVVVWVSEDDGIASVALWLLIQPDIRLHVNVNSVSFHLLWSRMRRLYTSSLPKRLHDVLWDTCSSFMVVCFSLFYGLINQQSILNSKVPFVPLKGTR